MKYQMLLLALVIFCSCDVVELDEIYEETTPVVSDTTADTSDVLPDTAPRKVLLEYYTGHLCGNCPGLGGTTLKQLKDLYGENLVAMAIHSGFFARVNSTGTSFNTDFRTSVGTSLDDEYGVTISGTPKGLINRTAYESSTIQTPANWGSAISATIGESTDVVLRQSTTIKDASTLSVELEYRIAASNSIRFYIIEDSIVDWQRDYDASPEDIEDYVHRYVLRDEVIPAEVTALEGQISFDYSYPSTWNSDHLHVISIVENTSSGEIVQTQMQ